VPIAVLNKMQNMQKKSHWATGIPGTSFYNYICGSRWIRRQTRYTLHYTASQWRDAKPVTTYQLFPHISMLA